MPPARRSAQTERRAMAELNSLRRLQQAKRLPAGTQIQIARRKNGRWIGHLRNKHASVKAVETRPARLLAELARRYAKLIRARMCPNKPK